MALQATHMRFAIDLEDSLGISDIDKYVSGTTYPDSRYPTGIAREITHSNNLIPAFLGEDDSFKKGWAVHLVCDNVQSELFREWFPEIFASGKLPQGTDGWIAASAIKSIQDVEDVKYFDVRKYLSCLDYVNNPNDEDIGLIRKYNDIVQNMYQKHLLESLEQRHLMFVEAFRVSEDAVQKMRERAKEYLDDKDVMDRIRAMYDEMLRRGRDYIHNTKVPETTK